MRYDELSVHQLRRELSHLRDLVRMASICAAPHDPPRLGPLLDEVALVRRALQEKRRA